jgi:hypothetical protein
MTFHVSVQYFQNTTFHVSVFCFQNTREGHTATLHKTEISCQCALAFEGHGSGGAQAGVHTGAEGARDFVHASACMPPQTHPRAACMLASASSPTRPRELRCAPCWERRERMTTCMMLNSACMLLQSVRAPLVRHACAATDGMLSQTHPRRERDCDACERTRPAIRARSALSAAAHACMQIRPHSACVHAERIRALHACQRVRARSALCCMHAHATCRSIF